MEFNTLLDVEYRNSRAFSFQFQCEIINLGLSETYNALKFSVQDFSLDSPSMNLSYETLFGDSIFLNTLKNVNFPKTISITYREFHDFKIYKLMNDWLNKVFDRKKNAFKTEIKNQIKKIILYTSQVNNDIMDYKKVLSCDVLPLGNKSFQYAYSYSDRNYISIKYDFLIVGNFEEFDNKYVWK